MSYSLNRTRLIFAALVVVSASCIKLPPNDPAAAAASNVELTEEVSFVWDGDKVMGNAKEWASCNDKNTCKSALKATPGVGVNGSVGLEWQCAGKDWKGFGWNWFGWWPEDGGTDVSQHKNLSFWVRLESADPKKAPALKDIKFSLAASPNKGKMETEGVSLLSYVESLSDGKWHEVVVPLKDLVKGKGKDFDLTKAWEFRLGEYSMEPRDFSLFIDNIGFDSRKIVSLISLPEKREPAALGSDVLQVSAKLDLTGGVQVSPDIYGVSHGDVETLHEMGVAARRMGGNLSSVYDWRTGFTSAGADWFFENRKEIDTPHPQENWWVVMHRENKKYGMKSVFTLPSEWVAKDSTSSGFPKSVYPNCDQFAADRPEACNGKLKEKNKEGNPVELRCSKEHPTQNGKFVGIEYNVELVKYCIKDAGFGRADQGGVSIIALDNEPMLYRSTHRDIWCKGFTYDEFWERTKKAAELIRAADPSVKIAGPALWGWTAYVHSSADLDYREEHGLGWDKSTELPDYKKFGPFARDFMRRCAEYKKATGHDLIDIFVFHGYPMTPKLDWNNQAAFVNPTPELQEFRVRDVRKFWDETYRDPDTWMGKDSWANGNVAYIPLMKRWMKEVGWDVPLAIGEYDHAGPEGGVETSAAVAEAESLAAFARMQLTYAMYWADPRKHGPTYFAFKMFRNPDGNRTAVGDQFIAAEVSDADSVSVYAFKDKQKKVVSFMLMNKRASKGAKVTLELNAPVAAQKATRYEYSKANPKAIGELPPLDVSGKSIPVSIAPMSILRIDVKL